MENTTMEHTQETNTTTQGGDNMETVTTIEQVERPTTSNESLEVTGAVMVVSKKPNVAALAGAAAGGAAIGAGAFFATTIASRKLTQQLTDYLLAYTTGNEEVLKQIVEKNPQLGTLEDVTLYDFIKELDEAMAKAKIGWKNPFGATKKQIQTIQDLMGAAFAAKDKQYKIKSLAENAETVDKAIEEIEVKDNNDTKDNA